MTREELTKGWEEAIGQLAAQASEEAERIIHAQLQAWATRWPRHTFKAWDSMGAFAIEVSPPVRGQDFPSHLGTGHHRGAIADLCSEVDALEDWYNAFDHRATLAIRALRSDEQLPAIVQ